MEEVLPDILDQCLARLADGATVDECLVAYPAQQAELELPLRMASRLRELPQPALPTATRAGLETQLLALAAARRAANPAAPASQAPALVGGMDAILAGVLRALGYGAAPRSPWLRVAAAALTLVLALAVGAGTLLAARAIVEIVRPKPTPIPTAVPTSTAPPLAQITIDGPIEQIAQEGWVVGGTTVVLTSTTVIEGTPALGATAHVRASILNGGGWLAQSIVVEAPPTPTSTPTPTQTVTPTEAPAPTTAPVPDPAPAAAPSQPSPGRNQGGDNGNADENDRQKQPCQGQQRGRDEKKCDTKPHDDKKPPKPHKK